MDVFFMTTLEKLAFSGFRNEKMWKGHTSKRVDLEYKMNLTKINGVILKKLIYVSSQLK